ncbi:MAG: DNA-directed RNA polymerase subunit beta', partial [Patescibacteria group bacterium]
VSGLEKVKMQKRFNLIKSMKRAGVRPEWMFITVVPVIPPDLRPMVALEGGRHATSDVNDLYRRVINRNNRLRKLKELNAPEVILRNEKRILQEAVDALIDNSIRRSSSTGAMSQAQRRPLKSLSDSLKGKQGRFRQNLLGKRVDYSGRSVIVVGPHLKISECGLPKHMALELFRPFVISRILRDELAFNVRGAGRLIDEKIPEVWEILEDVIKDKYVLLNRAPTLHRLGIQAFRPILIEGSAIQVHPLVCAAFNADFDGDQMAVHVPLSEPAQKEADRIIAAHRNILKPGNGNPIVSLRLDIVLGCYWVTSLIPGALGEGKIFASPEEAIAAELFGAVDLRAKIKIITPTHSKKYLAYKEERFVETSVGRILFNETLPEEFNFINKEVNGKEVNKILDDLISRYGIAGLPQILDRMKSFGFVYATRSGVTWGIDDVLVPAGKTKIVEDTKAEAQDLEEKYNDGLLSKDERYKMSTKIWIGAKTKIEKLLPETLATYGSVNYMLASGARGSISQVSQMAGMKGLIINPAGRLIDFPIIPSYKEGLSPIEYFITTHGSRKTLTDTALNTAKAGYLTQRLVNVAQEVVVREVDCGDKEGKVLTRANISQLDTGMANIIRGRVLSRDLKNSKGKVIFKKGHLLSREDAVLVDTHGVTEVAVRTVLTCKSSPGICQACYGADLGRGPMVEVGEAVGIVAAQAIGEPGTQLTMRTKHSGGVDTGGDIVGGLPRVEEIFERRIPKNQGLISTVNGVVTEIKIGDKEMVIEILAEDLAGAKTGATEEFTTMTMRTALVKKGDEVKKGQVLTDGPLSLTELFNLAGPSATEEYVISEINKIYELQGASISRKHLEIIIKQMFSRKRVKNPGDTNFEIGEVVEAVDLAESNAEAKKAGGAIAVVEDTILGISEVALNSGSFLASVSFQQSTRTLIKTAVRVGLDRLRGLKENVIIGRLIPAGTGLKRHEYEDKVVSNEMA